MRSPWIFLLLVLTVVLPASAQQAERLLVPVVYNGPGAFGSTWLTSMQVLNLTSQPYQTPGAWFHFDCPIPEGCFSPSLQPQSYGVLAGGSYVGLDAPNGMFIYVPAGERRRLPLSLKIASSLHGRALWTEIPIVSEEQFRSDGVWLLSARVMPPSGIEERLSLRIYDSDGHGGRVRINAYSSYSQSDKPLASVEVDLAPAPSTAAGSQPLRPGFAQLRVEEVFPRVRYNNAIWNLEIVPLPRSDGSQMRVWAFITMTDNQTNQVTVISPQ